jgi:hypothetical protein
VLPPATTPRSLALLDAAIAYIRAAASWAGVHVRQACQELAGPAQNAQIGTT